MDLFGFHKLVPTSHPPSWMSFHRSVICFFASLGRALLPNQTTVDPLKGLRRRFSKNNKSSWTPMHSGPRASRICFRGPKKHRAKFTMQRCSTYLQNHTGEQQQIMKSHEKTQEAQQHLYVVFMETCFHKK